MSLAYIRFPPIPMPQSRLDTYRVPLDRSGELEIVESSSLILAGWISGRGRYERWLAQGSVRVLKRYHRQGICSHLGDEELG